jgi:hypothetical protein
MRYHPLNAEHKGAIEAVLTDMMMPYMSSFNDNPYPTNLAEGN